MRHYFGSSGRSVDVNTGGTLHILGAGGAGNITAWYLPYNISLTDSTLYFEDGSGLRVGANGSTDTVGYALNISGQRPDQPL